MKRSILSILTVFITTLSAIAQPRLSSNKETHNFGQIEWKHPVTVEYTITNTGDKPLVLTNVTTSCACSVADWTKKPIAPGEKGTVSATFDAKALGHFEKTIGIYSNAQPSLVYLKFVGEVVQEVTDFAKTHPYAIGSIRLDRTEFDSGCTPGRKTYHYIQCSEFVGPSLRTCTDAPSSLPENGKNAGCGSERKERKDQTNA